MEELQKSILEIESKYKNELSRLKKKYDAELHELELQLESLSRFWGVWVVLGSLGGFGEFWGFLRILRGFEKVLRGFEKVLRGFWGVLGGFENVLRGFWGVLGGFGWF